MSLDRRIQAIVDFPAEIFAYERWLDEQRKQASAARDYLFSEQRPRFEPRKDDVVVALPNLHAERHKGGTRLRCKQPAAQIDIKGVALKQCDAILNAIDGQRCLLEVRFAAGVSAEVLARFLRATFGLMVLAPGAVAANEARVSGIEIVRFPAPPYCIDRAYWDNMIDVREHFLANRSALDSGDDFRALLQQLHVLALMGASLESYYKPASPVADHKVAPGTFYFAPVRLRGALYLDGPRVSVPPLGGQAYQQRLCCDLGDEAALGDRTFTEDGIDWGRVATVRSERDDKAAPYFFPPRPLGEAHFDQMRRWLREGSIASLACFHRAWVRLHPFHCANQSIAMNLVNGLLDVGIPHMILDHMALRLSRDAYAEAFQRAVAVYAIADRDPATRLQSVSLRKQRVFAFIDKLSTNPNIDDPEAARWALLSG